ncbi:hypothetical protein CDAR_52741 [Caerostris darwini]|uniref:Uncharacterized protein n=1 Tax=Caerostris darwini TaxID=1538125 RepID=A0AAV4T515_9ARAC|nr:hypothetical protein CDAR_52741 [Caerostris darwini]
MVCSKIKIFVFVGLNTNKGQRMVWSKNGDCFCSEKHSLSVLRYSALFTTSDSVWAFPSLYEIKPQRRKLHRFSALIFSVGKNCCENEAVNSSFIGCRFSKMLGSEEF